VVVADVLGWLGRSADEVAAAQLCFLDAPYRDDEVVAALELLGASPPALVVCEHHRARHLPDMVGRLRRVREATYGTTRLTFWQRDPHGGDGDR
jgi:16S rRNA (guanine966-N2)-methyltransferase